MHICPLRSPSWAGLLSVKQTALNDNRYGRCGHEVNRQWLQMKAGLFGRKESVYVQSNVLEYRWHADAVIRDSLPKETSVITLDSQLNHFTRSEQWWSPA
jgi:hypothetical protein